MKPLTAADLKHQVTIVSLTEQDDDRGGYATVAQPIAQPWAEVTGLPGREAVMNQALQGVSVYRVRIWHRDGIDPGMQLRFGAIDLNIRSCSDPFGTRRELLIIADTAGTLAS